MLKLSKWLLKKGLPWQQLSWYGFNQHSIVFLDKFVGKSPNFVVVTVFIVKLAQALYKYMYAPQWCP